MRNRLPAVLLGLSAVWVSGCAEPPTARVDEVKQEVEALRTDAQMYAPDAYQAAEDAITQLDTELQAQEGRFGPLRSYDRAGELADSVETAAQNLQQAIDSEKERLRSEAAQRIAAARTALADARASIEDATDDEISDEQRSTWQGDLAGVEASLGQADQALANGQFGDARSQADGAVSNARAVSNSVADVQAELEAAREEAAARAARGDVTIPRRVLLDGQPLAPGEYQLRLGEERSEAEGGGRWVEFLRGNTVAGRGLAVVIPDSEIGQVAKSAPPRNAARVDQLKGGEYVRVWLNRNGMNYLIHMPIPGAAS